MQYTSLLRKEGETMKQKLDDLEPEGSDLIVHLPYSSLHFFFSLFVGPVSEFSGMWCDEEKFYVEDADFLGYFVWGWQTTKNGKKLYVEFPQEISYQINTGYLLDVPMFDYT